MHKLIYFIIFTAAVFFMLYLLNKLRRKTTNELEKVLFIQNNPGLYLQLLKNSKLKILYPKSTLLQFKLNACLLLGADAEIAHTVEILDRTPMSKGESLEYNQKKLSYYCTIGKKDKAETALQKIENILAKAKGEHAGFILKESKTIFDIYIKQDVKLIDELEEAQRSQQGVTRGLTLYRLAKLSFFKRDDRSAQDYLLRAKEFLAGTAWFDIVESALKDKTVLGYR